MAWALYAVLLVATLPLSPLAVLWMLGPLLVTGWHANNWLVPAAVGLGHGVVLGAVVVWLQIFPVGLGNPALLLAASLLVLLSWFTAIAGRTIRLVQVVRQQYDYLTHTQQRLDENAASVEAVWDASHAALITLDSAATIKSWNPGAEAVFKRSSQSMLGRRMDELAAPDDPDDCMVPIMYALENQRATPPFEGRMVDGRGQLLDVEVRARPVVQPGGDPGLILTVVDRTREHVMEDILSEQAERQDRLLQNLDEVLYSVEVPSRQTGMLTKTVEGLTGQSLAAFGDFGDFMDLAHPDDRQAVARRWEHARSGDQSTLRWRVRGADGHHVWVEDRVVPVRDDEGRVTRVDGIIRRIRHEIELERQAQRMTRWLDALEPLAGTGAWSVDLRTNEWTWSPGMSQMVGSHDATFENWSRRITTTDLAIVQTMVAHPESFAGPQRIHMIESTGHEQAYALEAWLQRGNDGEPIHLYGVLRRESTSPPTRPAGLEPPPLPADAIEQVWGQRPAQPDEPSFEEPEEKPLEVTHEEAMSVVEPEDAAHSAPPEDAPPPMPVPEPPPEPTAPPSIHAIEEDRPPGVEDVMWDDDAGWVPRMKPQPMVAQGDKDDAEEVSAKQWGDEEQQKPKGPWSLD